MMRDAFQIEIGTAFGPLQGRIWRLGAMGYNAMKHKVLITLSALEACLKAEGFSLPLGAAVPAAMAAWEAAHDPRSGRLWRHAAEANWPQGAHRRAIRHQLRGGRGKHRPQRR
jgi:hypothetical protein